MKKSLLLLPAFVIATCLAASSSLAAEPFQGKFVSNGKSHPLTFAGVFKTEQEGRNDDYEDVMLDVLKVVLTEKAPAAGQALSHELVDSNALGSYVVATFDAGSLKHLSDSLGGPDMRASINYGGGGALQAEGIALEKGVLSGRLHSEGEEDIFGEKLDIDATFSVKVE